MCPEGRRRRAARLEGLAGFECEASYRTDETVIRPWRAVNRKWQRDAWTRAVPRFPVLKRRDFCWRGLVLVWKIETMSPPTPAGRPGMSKIQLAVMDTGEANRRILNKDEYRADFRRVEAASLKRKTRLASAEGKRTFARCFYSFQASLYFVSALGRTKVPHEYVEQIEQAVRNKMDEGTKELNQAIDGAELLFKNHSIETVATYDTVPAGSRGGHHVSARTSLLRADPQAGPVDAAAADPRDRRGDHREAGRATALQVQADRPRDVLDDAQLCDGLPKADERGRCQEG
jgi:hypothetical protein